MLLLGRNKVPGQIKEGGGPYLGLVLATCAPETAKIVGGISCAPPPLPPLILVCSCGVFFNPHLRTCLFSERGREREGEEHQLGSSCMCSSGGLNPQPNLGMCPDPELNPQPFSLLYHPPTNGATPAAFSSLGLLGLRYSNSGGC